MKATREETIARRYCGYLGLVCEVKEAERRISVCPEECFSDRSDLTAVWFNFDSWRNLLFGRHDTVYGVTYGLCENWDFRRFHSGWGKIDDAVIRVGSLDELELQLSVRGF